MSPDYPNGHSLQPEPSADSKKVITGRFDGVKKITPPLLEALRGGDADAFKALYLITQRPLYAFVSRAYPRFDAEEISQAVMVDVWEKRENIDPARNFGAYIFRMAISHANKLYDRTLVEKSYLDYAQNSQRHTSGPEEALIEEETRLLYEIALRRMPERRRRIFEMYRNEGLSHEEIAAKLNVSRQTVNYNIHVAKKELSELLALFIALISISQ